MKLTREQVEEWRKNWIQYDYPENEPGDIENRQQLNALCDMALAALTPSEQAKLDRMGNWVYEALSHLESHIAGVHPAGTGHAITILREALAASAGGEGHDQRGEAEQQLAKSAICNAVVNGTDKPGEPGVTAQSSPHPQSGTKGPVLDPSSKWPFPQSGERRKAKYERRFAERTGVYFLDDTPIDRRESKADRRQVNAAPYQALQPFNGADRPDNIGESSGSGTAPRTYADGQLAMRERAAKVCQDIMDEHIAASRSASADGKDRLAHPQLTAERCMVAIRSLLPEGE